MKRPLKSSEPARLGERRILIDSHMGIEHTDVFAELDPKTMAMGLKAGGIQVAYLHAYCGQGFAYWPSKLTPMHPALKGRDLVGEFIRETRRAGVVPAMYMAPWASRLKVADRPDWVRRTPEGELGNGFCQNGPFGEHTLQVVEELARGYDFARLFLDGVSWDITAARGRVPDNMCYCARCRDLWQRLFHEAIPTENSERFRLRFFDFREHVVGGWLDRVHEAIHKTGRKALMVHNAGGGGWPMDRDDYVCVENHPMHGPHGTRLAGMLMRAMAPGKMQEYYPAWQIGCTDKPFSPAQLTHLFACSALNNAEGIVAWAAPRPSTNFFTPKFFRRVADAFDSIQPLWSQTGPQLEPFREVAIWFSRRNEEASNPRTTTTLLSSDSVGAYALCRRRHIPFGFLCDERLQMADFKGVKVLIVSAATVCQPETPDLLRAYLKQGGRVIFAGKSPLVEILEGVRLGEKISNTDHFAKPRFDVGTELIRLSEGLWPIESAPGCDVWATTVLPSMTDPPFLGRPGRETDQPTIISGRLGRGQWILFASEIFADYAVSCYDVLERTLQWALNCLGYDPAIEVKAPGCVDAEFYRMPGGMRVLMVAGVFESALPPEQTSPRSLTLMMDVVPISGVSVRTRLPVKAAVNLAGRKLAVGRSGDQAIIRLPPIRQFAAITLKT